MPVGFGEEGIKNLSLNEALSSSGALEAEYSTSFKDA